MGCLGGSVRAVLKDLDPAMAKSLVFRVKCVFAFLCSSQVARAAVEMGAGRQPPNEFPVVAGLMNRQYLWHLSLVLHVDPRHRCPAHDWGGFASLALIAFVVLYTFYVMDSSVVIHVDFEHAGSGLESLWDVP